MNRFPKLMMLMLIVFAVSGETVSHAQFMSMGLYADGELDSRVESNRSSRNVEGVGMAIIHNGQIVYLKGYGSEDREADIPVDPRETRFRWASVAKTMTVVVAMQAEEDGYIELNKNVSYYYPSYQVPGKYYDSDGDEHILDPAKRVITMQQLLTHTSGIQHYSNGFSRPEPPAFLAEDQSENTGMEWALKYWKNNPLVFVPESRRGYSTPAYNLAGVVLEKKMGLPFEQLVLDRIAGPADMTTLRADTLWNPAPRRAAGYRFVGGSFQRQSDDDVTWKLAAGGFVSTVEDMGKYAKALLDDELLSAEQKQTIWTNLPVSSTYGYSWKIEGTDDNRRISHTGAQRKARSVLVLYPEQDLAVAIMTNVDQSFGIDAMAQDIEELLLERLEADESLIKTNLSQTIELTQTLFAVPRYSQFYRTVRSTTSSRK